MVTTAEPRSGEGAARMLLAGRSGRRWRSVLVAVALMAAGATAVVLALGQVDQRVPILVASGDLPAGHRLTAADVRVVEVAGVEGASSVSDVDQAVGATLTVPVVEGAVLAQAALGREGDQLDAGQATVSAQLTAGRVPSSVRAGSQVSVVITDDGGQASFPALVQTLTPLSQEPGSDVLVDLVVDSAQAAQLARAAAEEQISVVHTPGGGG